MYYILAGRTWEQQDTPIAISTYSAKIFVLISFSKSKVPGLFG